MRSKTVINQFGVNLVEQYVRNRDRNRKCEREVGTYIELVWMGSATLQS